MIATVIASFFNSILGHFYENWEVIDANGITRQGVIFLTSWGIVTFGVFIFDFLKNKELDNKDKKSERLTKTLDGIAEVRIKTLDNLVDYLDKNYELKHLDKNYKTKSIFKVASEPREQLKEMVKQIEQRLKFFFNPNIQTKTTLAYRSQFLNDGKWQKMIRRNIRQFNPQEYSENGNTTFYHATEAEGLIFHNKKTQAAKIGLYEVSELEGRYEGKKPKGSILCFGFGVASEDHDKLVYIEAVLSISTKYKPFIDNIFIRKKHIIDIQESLEFIIFNHYIDKLKIELTNFFIQEINKIIQENNKKIQKEIKEKEERQRIQIREKLLDLEQEKKITLLETIIEDMEEPLLEKLLENIK